MTILPPLRRTAADAEAFARVVHKDQVDKAGRPYVEHLERVTHAVGFKAYGLGRQGKWPSDPTALDEMLQIAWLHDVIEDTERDAWDLEQEGFSREVAASVEMLTRGPQELKLPYQKWIEDIARRAPLPVLLVKIADTEDNADPARLALLPEATRDRLTTKYATSLPLLRKSAEARAST